MAEEVGALLRDDAVVVRTTAGLVDQAAHQVHGHEDGQHVQDKETCDDHHLLVVVVGPGLRSGQRIVQDEADLICETRLS